MLMAQYKVDVVDSDVSYLRHVLDTLKGLEPRSDSFTINGLPKAPKEFREVAENVTVTVVNKRQLAKEYVEVNSVDLVVLEASDSDADISAVEAAEQMRELGYKGRIAMQTPSIVDGYTTSVLTRVIDDVFIRQDAEGLFRYIAEQYAKRERQ